MKLINKGKILGKFNLFDVMIVLLVILCGVTAYVKITTPFIESKLFYKGEEAKEVLITIVIPDDMNLLDEYINIGDICKERPEKILFTITGKEVKSDIHGDKRLFVKLKANAETKPEGVLTVRGRPLRIGGSVFFSNKNIEFRGTIVEIENN